MAWNRNDWRVQRAIATVLAAAPLGCSSTWDCGSGDLQRTETTTLTQQSMDVLAQQNRAADWDELTCATVCEHHTGLTNVTDCTVSLPSQGTVTGAGDGSVACTGQQVVMCEGRRPLGHRELGVSTVSVGASLAAMAHLELASIAAFEELATQLQHHWAPRTLIARCEAAAADERRHAALLIGHARDAGAAVAPAERDEHSATLFDIALHNAVEGCVHEAWAAYVATERARRASSPALCATFEIIATDETRHGDLAWDIHNWLLTKLTDDETIAVLAAQSAALAALPDIAATQVGLPQELGNMSENSARQAAKRFAQELAI